MRAEVWVGPERCRRWTVEEKVATVREAFAPGARVAEVARRRAVSRAQLYFWGDSDRPLQSLPTAELRRLIRAVEGA